MKTAIRGLAVAGLMLMAAGSASAGVTVTYSHPERYTDLPFPAWEREEVLKDLTAHFEKLSKTLQPGTDLKVEVLDVDLAGRLYPNFSGARELRVLRGGADWPTIHLRYTLEREGKVIASGEERLSNMMYLDRGRNSYLSGEALRYEKQMIDEWFKERIVAQR